MDGGHLADRLVRSERLGAEQGAQLAARLACERDAALAYVVLALERDRLREGEVRRRVARSLLLRARDERRGLVVAPARDRSVDPLLPPATNVDEACAFRGAEPFVAVAGIEVRVELLEVEVELCDCVRAVDDRHEAFRACARHDLLDREQQRRLGGDVGDENGSRSIGPSFEQAVDRGAHVARAGP